VSQAHTLIEIEDVVNQMALYGHQYAIQVLVFFMES
jgi:hypothetical protein